MVILILAIIKTVSLMEKASMCGKIKLFIKEIFKMVSDQVWADYNKTVVSIMKAVLKKILSMDSVFKCIKTVIFSKENITRELEATVYIQI